jgi:hypothetical protein
MKPAYHIAQFNLALASAPLDDPLMAEFVARSATLNALADISPGFVWRLKDDSDNTLYVRPFADERVLVNFSVWESLAQLRDYVYRTAHNEAIRLRHEWFAGHQQPHLALWWISAGVTPTLDDANARLEHLRTHGATPSAFTFKKPFAPPS